MRIISSLDELRAAEFSRGTAVAVGKFDGVHLGHQAVIDLLKAEAEAHDLESVVFTFTNNPLSLLQPSLCPTPLSSPQQRLELLEAAGVDCCVMVDFDWAFAEITAEDFIDQILVEQLRAKFITLGSDFRFGHMGKGDRALLLEFGPQRGFVVDIAEDVCEREHGTVSSSKIREAVRSGEVALAGEMLGRRYAVRGEVVHGDARGRDLGFPTANLGGEVEGLIPADGVYAGTVVIDGVTYVAAISVGVNLTFDPNGVPRVEAYVLDFEGDLYGKQLEVQFQERIRPMLRFDSVDALVERMHEDVRETRRLSASA